ncbi:N-acetylglucosamine kinase [Pseudoroseicyclus aestuarii]|uniref:N-acetylglucosamine kinase-like BadF-type ATPase n=1 Tax=Pseudoroseicyclus aestuarii TaxID=1795041 RepID=A0A318SYV9_9RHOB|nr:BadF/BadG/BcrA/BcrD ATPase family protein [Pseudoroseicyclus aestuarii]PYE85609.1 N-acetylglucosamine kinase-like BadF-type ATPase [Pseudoroseicyclus aestuarii]
MTPDALAPTLGVDIGGTASRWCLLDARDQVLARGTTPGASGRIETPAALAALEAALARIAKALPAPPCAAGFGITGAGLPPHPGIEPALTRAFGLPPARLWHASDAVLAWHAAFPRGGAGHLVISGTGSVGIGMGPEGPVVVGGRGLLLDDAGSGGWIALRALDLVLRAAEEAEAPGPLAKAIAARLGGLDRDAVYRFVYGQDRGAIGLLARDIAAAAEAGDAAALALLTRAGQELARLARATIRACGPGPVALTGGAAALHPAIGAAFAAGLPGTQIDTPSLDAPARAAGLARDLLKGQHA